MKYSKTSVTRENGGCYFHIRYFSFRFFLFIIQGRGGLGSVYVFATGNSGGDDTDFGRDSCAYDRLVTNRYVISVAGTYKRSVTIIISNEIYVC